MPVTGLELPFGVKVTNPVPVDAYAGPFDSLPNALAGIPMGVRYVGREFIVVIDGNALNYQFYSGINDEDVVWLNDPTAVIDDSITSDIKTWSSGNLSYRINSRSIRFNAELLETINVNLASVTSTSFVFDGEALGNRSVFLAGQEAPLENGFYAFQGGVFTKQYGGGSNPIGYFFSAIIVPRNGVNNVGGLFVVDELNNNIDPALISFTWKRIGGIDPSAQTQLNSIQSQIDGLANLVNFLLSK